MAGVMLKKIMKKLFHSYTVSLCPRSVNEFQHTIRKFEEMLLEGWGGGGGGGKGKCDAIVFYLVEFASICFFAVETMWV